MSTHKARAPKHLSPRRWIGRICATVLAAGVLAGVAGCDSGLDGDIAANCSIAYGSPDDSYAKFVNLLSVHVLVRYDDRPLEAIVNKRSCDLMGVFADDSEPFTVQRCGSGDFESDGSPADCDSGGPTTNLRVTISAGESETITVNEGFFE